MTILLEKVSFSFRDLKKKKKQISENGIESESDKVESVCILELISHSIQARYFRKLVVFGQTQQANHF